MATLKIDLSETDWQRLRYLAECRQVSPEALAREIVSRWLQLTEEDWQKRMEQLLQAFRRASQYQPPEDIEAEITAAYEEYRQRCAP
ncbi:MAG: hypothetical protein K6U12_05690 [Armatimonadetes bacterium]|jgi:glutathione S-transferase|nr:hypothetical protein [Armatimonadota bacterium]CUU36177.1 hypothetical protein DCOP10_116257 [Armatimonadetes bacterium DC]CUU36961.1 hypothetical protein GXSOP10_12975 [Armatimonadetes bacterium GXS]